MRLTNKYLYRVSSNMLNVRINNTQTLLLNLNKIIGRTGQDRK